MPTPGSIWLDIHGLQGLAGSIDTVADDVSAIVEKVEGVPAPSTATYGWQPTADAMDSLLSAWSAEVDLLRKACNQIGEGARNAAELLAMTDGANAGSIGSVGP